MHALVGNTAGGPVSKIYAHSVQGRPQSDWETLEEHSVRVGRAARMRAERFGAGGLAEGLGLLHDLGKANPAFQRRLAGEAIDVPHAAAGAAALRHWHPHAGLLEGIIAGHHGRLRNPDRLKNSLENVEAPDLPDWCRLSEFTLPDRILRDPSLSPYRLHFLIRMLYGALCDADDRETGAFYAETESRVPVSRKTCVASTMREAFDDFMAGMSCDGEVNALRHRVLDHALQVARDTPPGSFTLTVPTGGGKTLTSLGFGLTHALEHGLDRLIFVIPYMSIVEQTADVFRKVLGDRVVLEHHSNADWDGEDESEGEQLRVMGASWDVPVVVTTAVQFFESLYAARKKRCRKLPSLARSIIVIDEAQTMPLHLLRPCLAGLRELTEGYGASVVLSTATQPALTRAGGFPNLPEAFEDAREIAPDPPQLFDALRRVEVRDIGPQDDHALAARIRGAERVLVIVDNREQARGIFDLVRELPGAAHLSTLMVPAHRRSVLAKIRTRLADQKPVRLVSTSLIEAGVDVDFPLVLRAAAGIDSIAQAAGRCNREGRMTGLGRVEVFRSAHSAPPAVEQFAEIGRAVLNERHGDPIGQQAVASYFRRLWEAYGESALDCAETGEIKGILRAIAKSGTRAPFEDIEAAFRMIEEGQRTVIIRDGSWGIASSKLDALRFSGPGVVSKTVQAHTLTVPWKLWNALWADGLISWWEAERFQEQFAVLTDSSLYDIDAGLGGEGAPGGIL